MKKQYLIPSQRNVAVAACLFAIGSVTSIAHAEFALDFKPVAPANSINVLINCPGVPDACKRMQDGSDPDTTPFFMETAADPTSGYWYYHVLIGDDQSDFAQEYFINQVGGNAWWPSYPQSASMGGYNGGTDAQPTGYWTSTFYAPLDSNATHTGNGTANPQRVIFRQVVKSTDFSQEVVKSSYLKKPKITQTVSDGEMSSDFVLDMSALGYTGASALTTGGVMTNTMVVTDSQSGGVMTDFDINATSQNSYINSGKYSYTNGTGKDGSFGTYTYTPGAGFDIYNVNWAAFYDKSANQFIDPSQSNIPNY